MKKYYNLDTARKMNILIAEILTCILNCKYQLALNGLNWLKKKGHINVSPITSKIQSGRITQAISDLSSVSSAVTNQACLQNGGSKW